MSIAQNYPARTDSNGTTWYRSGGGPQDGWTAQIEYAHPSYAEVTEPEITAPAIEVPELDLPEGPTGLDKWIAAHNDTPAGRARNEQAKQAIAKVVAEIGDRTVSETVYALIDKNKGGTGANIRIKLGSNPTSVLYRDTYADRSEARADAESRGWVIVTSWGKARELECAS